MAAAVPSTGLHPHFSSMLEESRLLLAAAPPLPHASKKKHLPEKERGWQVARLAGGASLLRHALRHDQQSQCQSAAGMLTSTRITAADASGSSSIEIEADSSPPKMATSSPTRKPLSKRPVPNWTIYSTPTYGWIMSTGKAYQSVYG